MKVGDLVRLKASPGEYAWNDGIGLVLAITKHLRWKDPQVFVYWTNEKRTWTFSVRHLEVINESR